jgi:hypothetical protein
MSGPREQPDSGTDDAAGPTATRLRPVVGDLRQVCRIDRLVHEEGRARGARLVRLVTGGGLEVELHPDRCLDIGHVTWRGQPVAWASPAPTAGPAFAEHGGNGWLRTFSGGLLTTCGLDQFGAPSSHGGEELGLHGRASSLPAQHLSTACRPEPDGRVLLEVSGEMAQARLFGENLLLHRRVRSQLGSAGIEVLDTVTNRGVDPQPHLLLYHLNLGWPLIDEGATVDIPSRHVEARDAAARRGLPTWRDVPAPAREWEEQVLRHELPQDAPVSVRVTNARAGLALRVDVHTAQLPHLFQWRLFRQGTYVLGIEPANSPVITGRAAAAAGGSLPVMQAGEVRTYRLGLTLSDA